MKDKRSASGKILIYISRVHIWQKASTKLAGGVLIGTSIACKCGKSVYIAILTLYCPPSGRPSLIKLALVKKEALECSHCECVRRLDLDLDAFCLRTAT